MDVADLYTMIPQGGGVTAIKRLLEESILKKIDGVKKQIVLDLTRFVMPNYYSCGGNQLSKHFIFWKFSEKSRKWCLVKHL